MTRPMISDKLELAVLQVSERLGVTKPGSNWVQTSEHLLWHELVACILGSTVSFEHAQAAARHLDVEGLLGVADCLSNREQFELRIIEALSSPIYPPVTRSGKGRRYRYPRLRANHIRRSAESIYQSGRSIKYLLRCSKDAPSARMRIISTAVGIGPKQASLFLQNIGYADDLAILDVHVLRYMFLQGFLPRATIGTAHIANYEKAEERLREYAEKMGMSVSRLDTAVWVVMRVFRREFAV